MPGEIAAGPLAYDGWVQHLEPSCEQADDAALMVRVVARDQQAFAELYDRWSARLLALAVQVLVDRAQS